MQVAWAAEARFDYAEIISYIARDNPHAARGVAQRIHAAINRLSEMPTGRQGRVAGTYEKVVPNLPYIIAYAIDHDRAGDQQLVMLRIIHGARNWQEGSWPET